jgi:hypothetical protein
MWRFSKRPGRVAAAALAATVLGGGTVSGQIITRIDRTSAAAATRVGRTNAPETFGVSSVVLSLNAWAFEGVEEADQNNIAWDGSYRRTCLDPAICGIDAPLVLPNGALIDSIELEACDTSATAEVGAILFYYPLNSDNTVIPAGGFVLSSGAPGCTTFSSSLTPPIAVNNADNTYFLEIGFIGGSGTAARAVRVRYRLQVSPAPLTATFPVDVPTGHPLFRFVEALAAAGITSGCGAGMYCPDGLITRGQMAVFLSVALGLHFPN